VNTDFHFLTRRGFVLAAAGVAASAAIRPAPSRASAVDERLIKVGPGQARLTGPDGPLTPVWAYDGTIPGPTLRLRQGQPVRVTVENGLDEEASMRTSGAFVMIAIRRPPIKKKAKARATASAMLQASVNRTPRWNAGG